MIPISRRDRSEQWLEIGWLACRGQFERDGVVGGACVHSSIAHTAGADGRGVAVSKRAHEVTLTTPNDEAKPSDDGPRLIAYAIHPQLALRIVLAPATREWIDETDQQFARRCLPVLIANQADWFILNSHALRVTWNGSNDQEGLTLEWLSGSPPYPAISHFGHGILTFTIPYLFRTSPGFNLLARGPANWPKDGVSPLEGLVETDWSVATFTMNWFMTAVDHPVEFEAGEPICMLVPQQVSVLETIQPEVAILPPILGCVRRSRSGRRAAVSISSI